MAIMLILNIYIHKIIHLKYDFLCFLVIVAVIQIKYDVVMGDHLESKMALDILSSS